MGIKSLFFHLLSVVGAVVCQMQMAVGEEYVISRLQAKIVPENHYTFTMPEGGEVEGWISGEKRARKGDVLLRINPRQLERDEANLKLRLERDRLTMEENLVELERQREELAFLLGLNEKQRQFLQKDSPKVNHKSLQIIDGKIELEKKRAALERQNALSEFEEKKKRYVVEMPFDGKFQYHFVLPERGLEPVMRSSSDPVVSVIDDSRMYLAVVMFDPDLIHIAPDRLKARVHSGGGNVLVGKFAYQKVEKGRNEPVLTYFFRLENSQCEEASRMIGANCVASLAYVVKGPFLYKHKLDLIVQAEKSDYHSWEELVSRLYPGYRIEFKGDTHLGLVPVEERKVGFREGV